MALGLLLSLAGCGVEPRVEDLRTIKRPDSPNDYLICAKPLCAAAVDEEGPMVDLPPEKVLVAALKVAAAEDYTSPAEVNVGMAQIVFVQRTPWLRFPDIVRIQAVASVTGRTGVALYSRSVYGYYDFGTNKARARRWMAAIQAELQRN
ncbi:MAG: DUF1499 domain-containing protein [Alphaproteobacteria bacterium]|nr:DUF1499 domain-containing protein [Alphaproteobacteria bacterium]